MNRSYRLLAAMCGASVLLLAGCPDDSEDTNADSSVTDIVTNDIEQPDSTLEDTGTSDPDIKDEDIKTCECSTNTDCANAFVDLDVCKIPVCDTQTCQCVIGNQKDYTPCDDDDTCTGETTCSSGVCGGGVTKTCDDGNPCTTDSCGANGNCVFEANNIACDDGNSCTADDACTDGKCSGVADAEACGCESDADCAGLDDGNLCNGTLQCVEGVCQTSPDSAVICDVSAGGACTTTTCNPATGACETNAATNGAACSDGNVCTQGDACQDGACAGGVSQCDCVATADCTAFEDGNLCNGTLVCQGSKCIVDSQSIVTCQVNDSVCKVNTCNPATGVCDANNALNGTSCDDSNTCTSNTKCSNGTCSGGATNTCDDGNACTDDSCEPVAGCVNAHNTASCDDGNACTTNDTCALGECTRGAALVCDDGNPCTDDSCDSASGCVVANNQAACDDANACTTGDQCAEGACVGPNAVPCDDQNPCTADSCDPATGCVFTPVSGEPCDDGNFCTVDDACDTGVCQGNGFLDCNDGNGCTNDACDPASGCTNNPGAGGCNDGNPCTTNDKCQNSACVGGALLDCDDGNPCTADACDPATGCTHTNDNSATCDDGQSCNGVDACVGGQCTGTSCACTADADCPDNGNLCDGVPSCNLATGFCSASPPVVCDNSANTVCTKNLCQPATGGCTMTDLPTGTACDDGDLCTIDDQCAAGVCAGADVVCDDGNLCTTNSCDAGSGACLFNTLANGAACDDDGDDCTSDGVCVNLQCTDQEDLCEGSDCCEAKEVPGCNDPVCEECVCTLDTFCCDTAWDDVCVGEAALECFDSCGCEGEPGGNDSCCAPSEAPGCEDADCQDCVCAFDDFCCTTSWDDVCVGEAIDQCGDICGCELPPGGCCLPGDGSPGCTDEPDCETCVCNLDAFCCDTSWDQLCANCASGVACGDPQDDTVTCGETCICPPDEPEPDCCIAGDEPGCPIEGCADCVCANDPVCCEQMWDDLCAEQAVLDCTEACNCVIPSVDCCEAHETTGCDDTVCQDCVCTLDAFCCDTAWDDICVGEAGNECNDACGCGGGTPGGVCCTPSEVPGCEDAPCQDCVCTLDAFCCDTAWDDTCVDEASNECNDACDCGGGSPGGACCAPSEAPGCEDALCQDCVCTLDAFCCDTAWDDICVGEAGNECNDACGCGGGTPGGACCTPSEAPGCEDAPCQDCVCTLDAFCCDTAWDDICVGEAGNECNDACGCGGGTGPGSACCEPGDSAGCGDETCEGCVCAVDDFCCDVAWDQTCADLALGDCTESCICLPGGDGPCCAASEAPGCVEEACETCVCTLDAFCCDTAWDDICVDEATADCGAECGCTGGGGGDSPNCTEILDCFVECTTQACADACIAAGDLASQQAFVDWFLCLDNSGCLDATTQPEFDACLEANCLEETIICVDDL